MKNIHHQLIFSVFSIQFMFLNTIIKAQTPSTPFDLGSQEDAVSNFQPSLAVVIGILSIMFSLTFILVLYAKFCHRSSNSNSNSPVFNQLQIHDGLPRSRSRSSGIDKSVIESLPFFRFSSLKGFKQGLDCSICLSKFEDIEILRLLPKCKHAFHINCLDQWLEKHSSCPLCRCKISPDDLSTITYSNSLRFLCNNNNSEGLYVQREESNRGGSSSRFTSFRKTEELPIQSLQEEEEEELHRFNHKIIVSDVFLMKNRWSNVSSSDLMFLNSEMIHQISSNRFSDLGGLNQEQEQKPTTTRASFSSETKRVIENSSKYLNQSDKRSMSEIIVHPRFQNFMGGGRSCVQKEEEEENGGGKEEKRRRIWLPIARRTVEWFANNRERRRRRRSLSLSSSSDDYDHLQEQNVRQVQPLPSKSNV